VCECVSEFQMSWVVLEWADLSRFDESRTHTTSAKRTILPSLDRSGKLAEIDPSTLKPCRRTYQDGWFTHLQIPMGTDKYGARTYYALSLTIACAGRYVAAADARPFVPQHHSPPAMGA
jgi:hypothetical protein